MRSSLLMTPFCLLLSLYMQGQGNSNNWNVNGNSNINASHKFGTTNNMSIRFVTNNTERLKILNSGNIGIGTSNPVQKLHVNGNGVFTGNFGIGTTTPQQKLHVNGASLLQGFTKIESKEEVGLHVIASYSTGNPNSDYYNHSEIGIVGEGDFSGVAGYATHRSSSGVYGAGDVGVWGKGNDHGIFGEGNYAGIFGTSTEGYAGYFNGSVFSTMDYTASDRNLKKDITDVEDALTAIGKLKPKYYSFRNDGKLARLNLPKGMHYGLIAQELETVMPGLVKTSQHKLPGQKPGENSEEITIKSVSYTELVPVLVKAVQELDAENKELKEQLADLRQMVLEIKNSNSGNGVNAIKGYLEGSKPNPAGNNTLISYHIPQSTGAAYLVLTNMKGQLLKQINVTARGTGQLTLNTSGLPAGTYNYILYVDGKITDSKKLVVAR